MRMLAQFGERDGGYEYCHAWRLAGVHLLDAAVDVLSSLFVGGAYRKERGRFFGRTAFRLQPDVSTDMREQHIPRNSAQPGWCEPRVRFLRALPSLVSIRKRRRSGEGSQARRSCGSGSVAKHRDGRALIEAMGTVVGG